MPVWWPEKLPESPLKPLLNLPKSMLLENSYYNMKYRYYINKKEKLGENGWEKDIEGKIICPEGWGSH